MDGLRALSVTAVFAYHLNYEWASGGFLGVDVFFVLSGYLITSLLLAEWSHTGTIDFRAFWGRRARRLLPACFFLLGVLSLYAVLIAPPDQLDTLREDMLATIFYLQNWWLIAQGSSYFDLYSAPSPLRHTWSLAIEEQFYIFWPLIALGVLYTQRKSRKVFAAVCAAGILASAMIMVALYDAADPSRAYYDTGSRAHTLLVGALLALLLEGREELLNRYSKTITIAGSLAFVTCIACFALVNGHSFRLYHGGSLLFCLAVSVVIMVAIKPGNRDPLSALLCLKPVQKLGLISYGVYLWHWPVIVLLPRSRLGLDGTELALAQILITLLLSTFSYLYIEQPFRSGALKHKITAWHGVGSVTLLVIAIGISTHGGTKARPDYLVDRKDPINTTTPSTDGRYTIGVVGDSVATSLYPGLQKAFEPLGIEVVNHSHPGCGFLVAHSITREGNDIPWTEECGRGHQGYITQFLAGSSFPQLVFWMSTWDHTDQLLNGRRIRFQTEEGIALFRESLDQAVQRFNERGMLVVLTTFPSRTVSDFAPADLDPDGDDRTYARLIREYADANPDRVRLLDVAMMLCPDGPPCPSEIEGFNPRPKDGGHYSPEGAYWLAQKLQPSLSGLFGTRNLLNDDDLFAQVNLLPTPTETKVSLRIEGISWGSAAWNAGFRNGDVITAINGRALPNVAMTLQLLSHMPNEISTIEVQQGGESKTLTLPDMNPLHAINK